MTIPEQARRSFSVVAYLAAVAGGCLLMTMFVIFQLSLERGFQLDWGAVNAGLVFSVPMAAMTFGFLPGLLIFLPGTLLCVAVANRFHLYSARWYAIFGALVGLLNPALLVFARWGHIFQPVNFSTVAFTVAGTGAGLLYFFTEQLENRSRAHRR